MSGTPSPDESLDWAIRSFIYERIAVGHPPPVIAETARAFGVSIEVAKSTYERLHERHVLVLEADRPVIRMAHPFSAVSTPFRVHADGRAYWANCAWDALGIPAALHADAVIAASCADDGTPVTLRVEADQVHGNGEVIHFLRPFRDWYDDLIFT